MGLRTRGETVDDIVAGVRVMRANMKPSKAPEGADRHVRHGRPEHGRRSTHRQRRRSPWRALV